MSEENQVMSDATKALNGAPSPKPAKKPKKLAKLAAKPKKSEPKKRASAGSSRADSGRKKKRGKSAGGSKRPGPNVGAKPGKKLAKAGMFAIIVWVTAGFQKKIDRLRKDKSRTQFVREMLERRAGMKSKA